MTKVSFATQEYSYTFSQGHTMPSTLPTSFSSTIANLNAPTIDCSNGDVLRNGIGFLESEYCTISSNFIFDSNTVTLYTWIYNYEGYNRYTTITSNFEVSYKNLN